jgi:hypothetical protein
MHKLPVFTFSEEYKNYCMASYMQSFLKENLSRDGGYAVNDKTKRILVNKFNCTYKNQASPHAGLHYLEFAKEQDRTFFLLKFS